MSAKWGRDDLAVCVLPVGELELGCIYVVEAVLGRGRYRRDGMMGKGLALCGVAPPLDTDGFDSRRFIRASVGRAEHEHAVGDSRDAQ